MTLPIQQSAAPGDRLADERFAREAYKSRSEPKMTKHTDDELIAIVGDLGARLGRGEVIGQTPYAVKCWHAITALIERAKGAERERDEAIKDRNAYAEHVLRVAAEAKDGLAALEEIDACWDAYGTTGNRMNLTLSEQIASTLRELDDERENHGNAEGELKMAEEELAQLRATPPAAPSLPADVVALVKAADALQDALYQNEYGEWLVGGDNPDGLGLELVGALAPFADRVAGEEEKPTFDQWIDTLTEDVVQEEYGYEPGEYAVFPEAWRWAFDEGLTPSQAFKRALDAHADERAERERERLANYERIKAEDAALVSAPPPAVAEQTVGEG